MPITVNLDTRAGSGTVTMSVEDGLTALPTTSGEVASISKLEIDYDLEEDTEDVKNVFYAPSKFTLEFFDGLDDGSSLISLLDDYLSTDTLYIDFNFTTDDGHSFETRYEFSTKDVKADRIERTVEIESHLVFGGDMTIPELFDAYPNDVYTVATDGGAYECMPTQLFVQNALNELVPSNATTSIKNNTQIFGTDPFVDTKKSYVILQNQTVGKYDQENSIASMLYRLATMDGAIMGSMLGFQYLAHRNSTADSATITNDDVTQIEKELGLEDYVSCQVMFNNTRYVYQQGEEMDLTRWGDWGSLSAFSTNDLNKDGNKTLSVYLHVLGVHPATWDTANSLFQEAGQNLITVISGSLSTDENPEKDDTKLLVTQDPNLTSTDIITFKDYVYKPHLVRSSSSNAVTLETPLQFDIDTSQTVSIEKFVNKEDDFAQGAVEAYANAYGANGQERFKLTIMDIDSLDPHQPIYLDNSFREEYQDRYVQPSKLTYNLMTDKIEVEAYQIQ